MRNSNPPLPPSQLRSRSATWAGALLLGIVLLLTAGFLHHEKQALETAEIQRAELYARVLQDHAERTFNAIDIAVAAASERIDAQRGTDGPARLNGDLARSLNGMAFLRSLSLIDASGRVVASSAAANVGLRVDQHQLAMPAAGFTEALGTSVMGRDLSDIEVGRAAGPAGARTFVPLVRTVARPPEAPMHWRRS